MQNFKRNKKLFNNKFLNISFNFIFLFLFFLRDFGKTISLNFNFYVLLAKYLSIQKYDNVKLSFTKKIKQNLVIFPNFIIYFVISFI